MYHTACLSYYYTATLFLVFCRAAWPKKTERRVESAKPRKLCPTTESYPSAGQSEERFSTRSPIELLTRQEHGEPMKYYTLLAMKTKPSIAVVVGGTTTAECDG